MLQPVRTRWRKAHKGRIHGTATRASAINYGSFALKALQPERITGKQIEAARVALTRHMKRQGRVWTRIFPNIPVSKKPTEVRMGKGGSIPGSKNSEVLVKGSVKNISKLTIDEKIEAAEIAKKAYKEGRPIIDVALEETDLSRSRLTKLLDPAKLTKGGISK